MKKLISVVLILCTVNVFTINAKSLEDIVAGAHRAEDNQERDQFRNPIETIQFFGTKPTDHVLEMWPGNGWYSEILAPYVKNKGKFTAVTFGTKNLGADDKRSAFWSKIALNYREKMSNKKLYGKVKFTEFDPPKQVKIAKNNSIDVAYLVRILHIWDEEGIMALGLQTLHKALKVGGVLAVVQHRGNQVDDIGSSAVEGYLGERYVIEAAEKAGFKLVASSDINANSEDTKNHPKGVYTLAPTYAMGNKDKEKYQTMGESDRMTLKFIKVAK